MSTRIITCETCCGEGRMFKSRYGGNDPDVWDAGMCEACEGACVIEAQVEPRTLSDLDDEDLEMMQAQLERGPRTRDAERIASLAGVSLDGAILPPSTEGGINRGPKPWWKTNR